MSLTAWAGGVRKTAVARASAIIVVGARTVALSTRRGERPVAESTPIGPLGIDLNFQISDHAIQDAVVDGHPFPDGTVRDLGGDGDLVADFSAHRVDNFA